jgi:alpha-1,2-mannosyltransferase
MVTIARRVRAHRFPGPEVAILLFAVLIRVVVVLASAGYFSNFGYDQSVYYAAADGFVHGRLPYHDFTLLHPPGIMLALSPFAELGSLTNDYLGFTVGNIAFTVLGGVNAVLVVTVARRVGLPRPATLVAGWCYALYCGSIIAEYSGRLEPLGNFCALCGLLAFYAKDRASWRAPLLCGLAFGAAASVKLWWLVPLAIFVLAWFGRGGRRTAPLYALVGAALAIGLIDGPFFLVAPHQMVQMIVRDQLGRARSVPDWIGRLGELSTFDHSGTDPTHSIVAVIGLVLAALIVTLAWTKAQARPVVVLAVAQVVVMCVAPSWFIFYCDFAAVGGALTLGAAAARVYELRMSGRMRWVTGAATWLPAIVLAVTMSVGFASNNLQTIVPFDKVPELTAAVADDRCVMSDTPMALIAVDALSRSFADGCPNWVDVTGRTYSGRFKLLTRYTNKAWQHALRRYLTSGTAMVLNRIRGSGIAHPTLRYLERGGVLVVAGTALALRTARPARRKQEH